MNNNNVRVINERPSHVRAIMADNNRSALRIEAEELLAAEPMRKMEQRGFTQDEAAILRKAVADGVIKIDGLREIQVELDPLSRRMSYQWIGDDEGAHWHTFANPLRIGNFGDSSDSRRFPAPVKRWWQR